MSVKLRVQMAGFDELEKALKDLGSEVAGKKNGGLVRNALNAAGRDVEGRMKKGAPISAEGSSVGWGYRNGKYVIVSDAKAEPGRLKRAIKRFPEKNPRRLSEIVYVGPLIGTSRNDPSGAWYAAIVEFQGGKGGEGRGYMRNSIDRDIDTNTIRKNLATGIERVAKKIGNQNAAAVGARIKKL